MNLNNLTNRACLTISKAKRRARENNQESITPKDLLYGLLLLESPSMGATTLRNCSIDINDLKRSLGIQPIDTPLAQNKTSNVSPTYDLKAAQVIEKAREFAERIKTAYIGTEHITYALVAVEDEGTNILREKGLTPKKVEKAIRGIFGLESMEPQTLYEQLRASGYQVLDGLRDMCETVASPNNDFLGYAVQTGRQNEEWVSLFYTLATLEPVLDLRDWLEQHNFMYKEQNPESKFHFLKMLREEASERTKLADRLEGKVRKGTSIPDFSP